MFAYQQKLPGATKAFLFTLLATVSERCCPLVTAKLTSVSGECSGQPTEN